MPKVNKARVWLAAQDDEFLCADGFDAAIIGVTETQPGRPSLVVYDMDKCAEILRRQGCDDPDEFLHFNTIGAWVGDRTPVFIRQRPWKDWD